MLLFIVKNTETTNVPSVRQLRNYSAWNGKCRTPTPKLQSPSTNATTAIRYMYVLFHTVQSGASGVYSRPRIVNLSNEEICIFYAVTTTTNSVATSVAGDSNTVGLSEDSQYAEPEEEPLYVNCTQYTKADIPKERSPQLPTFIIENTV